MRKALNSHVTWNNDLQCNWDTPWLCIRYYLQTHIRIEFGNGVLFRLPHYTLPPHHPPLRLKNGDIYMKKVIFHMAKARLVSCNASTNSFAIILFFTKKKKRKGKRRTSLSYPFVLHITFCNTIFCVRLSEKFVQELTWKQKVVTRYWNACVHFINRRYSSSVWTKVVIIVHSNAIVTSVNLKMRILPQIYKQNIFVISIKTTLSACKHVYPVYKFFFSFLFLL